MRRPATTEIAVLGALSVEPMTGYAIRSAIATTLGHFWRESFGQIYPTLERLERERLVVRAAPGRTSGSTYRLTAAGRRRLIALLHESIPSAPPRNATLLRLFFGRLLDPDVCRQLVLDARDAARALLDDLAAVRADVETDSDPNAPWWLLTVSAGEHAARAQLTWADETLAALAALNPPSPA